MSADFTKRLDPLVLKEEFAHNSFVHPLKHYKVTILGFLTFILPISKP